ncbi:MAG TPA: tetratricopeptide repeat protein [Casimicrobiaceae bacterium]|jgi:tetratricopeptide (TPR) repeat protein
MDKSLTSRLSLELEPIADSASHGDARAAAPPTAVAPPPAPALRREDAAKFLAAAAREVEAGWIERPLWESLLAQCKGDEAATKDAYVRTRATELQLEKRNGPDTRSPASPRAAMTKALESAPGLSAAAIPGPKGRIALDFRSPRIIAIAACAVTLIGIGLWLAMRTVDQDAGASTAMPASAARVAHAAVAARAQGAKPAEDPVGQPTAVDDGLVARIDKLRDVGNWNVLVLLATEWTRREPDNPRAWVQLSDGYLELRQLPEALDAATRATQAAPTDADAWRHLARVHLALDRVEDAARDFEHIVALDGRDVQSLGRVGELNARLGRFAEAKAAFDKVLALYPDDVNAGCGLAFVARQQGQGHDAEAIEKDLRARGRTCADWALVPDNSPPQAAAYRRAVPRKGG